MTPLTICLDLERPGADFGLDRKRLVHSTDETAAVTGVGLLRHGTHEGNAVVMMVVTLPDGRQAVAQTTWKLWRMANAAMAASPIVADEVIDP